MRGKVRYKHEFKHKCKHKDKDKGKHKDRGKGKGRDLFNLRIIFFPRLCLSWLWSEQSEKRLPAPICSLFPISNHIIFSFSTSRHENGKNIREIRRSRDYFRFLNLFIDEVADYLITVDNIDFNWDMGDVECWWTTEEIRLQGCTSLQNSTALAGPEDDDNHMIIIIDYPSHLVAQAYRTAQFSEGRRGSPALCLTGQTNKCRPAD